MISRITSDFQITAQRITSTFNEIQSCLEEIKNSPLTLQSDLPHLTMWINSKCIQSLVNVFCLPIDFKVNLNIKFEALEGVKFTDNFCKAESNEVKIQESNSPSYCSLNQHSSPPCVSDEDYLKSRKEYKRGPYKNYTIEQKLAAVKMLIENRLSVIEVSKRLKIPCKNIKRWSQYGVERKKGGGRKRFSPETQRAVALHLKANYPEGSQINFSIIQDVARNLSDDPNFKASRGWVVKFVDRQHIRNYYKLE